MYRSHSDINPKEYYDISELARMGVFYWIKTRSMAMQVVKRDQELQNVLQVETTGTGKGTRYKIKGSNIIKFYKVYGPGINILKK